MTDPGVITPQGYPDWQPVTTQANVRLLTLNNQAANPTDVRGPFFVGNFPTIGIDYHLDSGRAELIMDFAMDATFAPILYTHSIFIDALARCQVWVPVGGSVMRTTVRDDTGAGSQYDLNLTLGHQRGLLQATWENNLIVAITAANVGAGATRNDQSTRVRPGWAYFQHRTAATASTTRLQHLDTAGAWTTIYERINVADQPAQLVFLPSASMRVQVINQGAAAAVFSHYLVGMPGIGAIA